MRIVGMLSGTSVDGLDVAVADFETTAGPDGAVLGLRPRYATTLPLPAGVRDTALAVLPPARTTAGELCRLDTDFGRFCGEAAARVVAEHGGDLVVSLGQTVFHGISGGRATGGLQLGQPAWIAEATGLPVVSDLRSTDIAAGGHGAPLASTLDALWLAGDAAQRSSTHRGGPDTRIALNLGGIANVTVVAPAGPTPREGNPRTTRALGPSPHVTAFDTGPANCLLDVVAARSGAAEGYDVDGRLAATGHVDGELLGAMLREPYFAQLPPKSTGRELFTARWLDAHTLERGIDDADLAATLVELTARTVADAVRAHGATTVIASGGGVRNPVLLARLGALLAPTDLHVTDEFGLPGDAKEAYLVALLGWLTWHGVPGVVPGGTGSTHQRILGRITPGNEPLRLPEPVAAIASLDVLPSVAR